MDKYLGTLFFFQCDTQYEVEEIQLERNYYSLCSVTRWDNIFRIPLFIEYEFSKFDEIWIKDV
jgi:hypothetical protein